MPSKTDSNVVDVLIIGGGPAGLSSALALSRQMYSTIIFDNSIYRNAKTSHMHAVPGFDHAEPSDYRATLHKDIFNNRYQSNRLIKAKITTISRLPNGHFHAQTDVGESYEGRKLVLATGIRDLYPPIDGYAENWGTTIFHCLFCHGFEERGAAHAGVLAFDSPMLADSKAALTIGCMVKRFAKQSTIYTHGNETMAARLRDEVDARSHGLDIDSRKISYLEKLPGDAAAGHAQGLRLHFETGGFVDLGFLAHTPRSEMTGDWAKQLGLEMDKGNYKVNMFGETSVPGCFAAGDCAVMAKSVNIAVSSGNFAAAGIAHQLVLGH